MEKAEERYLLKIKSRFYEMVMKDINPLQYKSILKEMLVEIRNTLDIDEVILCKYRDIEQEMMIEVSTNPESRINVMEIDNSNPQPTSFPLEKTGLVGWCIPLKQTTSFRRFLILIDEESMNNTFSMPFLQTLSEECSCLLEKLCFHINLISEQKRYKQLFRVTEKVHSSMNMESILNEIIDSLREVYPDFTYHLILSQDHEGYEALPIKEFDYDSENKILMEAYVTGDMQFEHSLDEKKSIIYAPLKGKQGVYGVLQINAPNSLIFPKNEIEFISLLAKTAGAAMENAQLYEQSRRLIADLQLINETSQRLNSSQRLTETIAYLSEQIVSSFGAKEVGFIQIKPKNKKMKIQAGGTGFFFTNEGKPYIHFVKDRLLKDHEAIFIGELNLPVSYADATIYKSMMAVPMLQVDVLNGFVIVLQRDPYAFSFDTFKLLKSLIHHSTLAFTNTILREELEKMVVTDHLTELYSRNYLDKEIKESMGIDGEGTFILMDIDNFKLINDTYGHQIGDEVIIQVAEIIRSNIRSSDVGARWGGEELAIYLPRVTLETGIQIAERLVIKVRETSNPKITISCGVSHWNKEGNDSYTSLFRRADQALYKAKQTGKNKVVVQR